MYQLPLRFIKVSADVAICATRVVALMSTASFQARETIKREKKAGTLINASGRETTKTAVFLDNGTIIASPMTVNRILSSIERSNAKSVNGSKANETKRLKVYEAIDEEPDDLLDHEEEEMTALIEDEEINE